MEPITKNGTVADKIAVEERIALVVHVANDEWEDSWINRDDHSIPDGVPTLEVWHIYNHILRWCITTGRFPENARLCSRYEMASRFGALCYRSYEDDYDFFEEVERFIEEWKATNRERIYLAQPHLRPFNS